MPGVSCPHQKLYRTVQQLRAEAPHPGVNSLFDRSQSNRKYNYNYIFTQMCGGGKCLSHFVHSFIPPHSLVYNTCKYFSTKLFIHFIISSYGVLCRHSYNRHASAYLQKPLPLDQLWQGNLDVSVSVFLFPMFLCVGPPFPFPPFPLGLGLCAPTSILRLNPSGAPFQIDPCTAVHFGSPRTCPRPPQP